MARLLFKLANVPDDEAQDIRALLSENEIAFYETDAGFWRVGLDAIWLADNDQEVLARELLASYQQQRSLNHRENRAQLAAEGTAPSFIQFALQHPLRVLGAALAIGFVLALSLLPFGMLLKTHL